MLLQQFITWKRGLNLVDLFTHIAFFILAVMAFELYAERLFADAAYYIFQVINKEWFYVEHSRFVLALSQFIPWIGVKVGLPLKVVLILYSVGHVIFFYVIFLVCRYRYYDTAAGLLLILLQTLGLEMGYYTPMFELYYGTGMLVLFATVLWRTEYRLTEQVLLIVSSIFALTSHPIAVILWLFVLLLHVLEFRKKALRWYGVFVGLLVLLVLFKSLASTGYEQTKTLAFFETYRVMSFGWGYIVQLMGFMVRYYSELLLLFFTSLLWMIGTRKYLLSVVVIAGFIGMLVIINGAHYGFQHSRYQEQVYFPLTWIVAFPLAVMINVSGYSNGWRNVLILLAFVLASIKIFAILGESNKFSNRVEEMQRQLTYARNMGMGKAIIGEANVSRKSAAGPNWSYGIETLLLSAQAGKDRCVTICLDTDMAFEGNAEKIKPDEFLMRKWNILPLSWLNEQYFSIDSGIYNDLNSAAIAETYIDSTSASSVEISVPDEDLHMPRGKGRAVQVRIINRTSIVLPSDTSHALFLSYHWKHGDTMTSWDGLRTPLELDIVSMYQQSIDVMAPEKTGHYTLVVDIVAEGRRWFGIDAGKMVWVY